MEWININDRLPDDDMKVEWLCEDGKVDVGFYFKKTSEFKTWDLISKQPITHWKPLNISLFDLMKAF